LRVDKVIATKTVCSFIGPIGTYKSCSEIQNFQHYITK